jgi:hypothetical protein
LIDEKRKELQAKQNVVFKNQRQINKCISDFLFKNSDSDLNQTGKFQSPNSNDDAASGQKPKAH